MNDQGAGGIESHMTTHRRQDSGEEPIPAEPTVETRAPAPKPKPTKVYQTIPPSIPPSMSTLSQSQSTTLHEFRVSQTSDAPVAEVPPALSRNSSSCSTSSNTRRVPEYLTAQVVERRPSPLSRCASTSAPPSTRPLEPPVTKNTLSELDVHKIIHNPKLRHDINFDPELHFRPNLDGAKGQRKQEKAMQFWNALVEQLTLFVVDRDAFMQKYGDEGDWCLPSLLKAVKDIIQTLVPQRDRELLNEGLNVELLMQQFNRGVADLEKLASWLSGVLKLHCAPMRDEWVDEMYQELSNGNRNNDINELVKGMRSLLGVLEAMKLDVANHQIRCLRPVLIDDTVAFEQRFFIRKLGSGKLDVERATGWYKEEKAYAQVLYADSPMPYAQAFGDSAVFFEALTRLILPSTSTEMVPATFLFDEERMLKLRADMYDSIGLEICMRKYEELERLSRVTYSRLPAYLGDFTKSDRSSSEFIFNSPPTSRPSSFAFSDRGSATSSPRSSGGLFAHSVPDGIERRNQSHNLYSSLLALLHTAPSASRPSLKWQGLAQPMALEILRSVNAPHSLAGFEKQLERCLVDVHGSVFREVEAHFQQRLLAELAKRVKDYKNLSGVSLFTLATGGRIHGTNRGWDASRERNRELSDEAGIEDMAIRLAHLGVLPCRVWQRLAYDIEEPMTDAGGSG